MFYQEHLIFGNLPMVCTEVNFQRENVTFVCTLCGVEVQALRLRHGCETDHSPASASQASSTTRTTGTISTTMITKESPHRNVSWNSRQFEAMIPEGLLYCVETYMHGGQKRDIICVSVGHNPTQPHHTSTPTAPCPAVAHHTHTPLILSRAFIEPCTSIEIPRMMFQDDCGLDLTPRTSRF